MKIAAISDLHGHLPLLPDADLYLIAGDVCPPGSLMEQVAWLNGPFKQWLPENTVGTWGNHDGPAEQCPYLLEDLPFYTDTLVVRNGLRVWCSPWTREFNNWHFMLREPLLDRKHRNIPECEIILSHGPPLNVLDKTLGGEHCGSRALTLRVQDMRPDLCVFGHIHEGRGIETLDETICANVTHVNADYHPIYEPRVIEL